MEHGIKETKEALVGVNELSLFLVTRLQDGLQSSDVSALVQKLLLDPDFKEKLEAAAKDVNKVPAEVKDISLTEALEVVKLQMEYVPKFIDALKKA